MIAPLTVAAVVFNVRFPPVVVNVPIVPASGNSLAVVYVAP